MNNNINFMINVSELNELYKGDKKIVIIDVRSSEEYYKGHIKQAINIPEIFTYLPNGLTTTKEKNDFVDFFEDVFSNAGIVKDEIVVFYEEKFTLKSPRGLTILKYLGYDEKKIKVLDGGYFSWKNSDLKISTRLYKNVKSNFVAEPLRDFFIDYDEMMNALTNNSIIKLDVRDKDEWIGISSSPYGMNFAPKKGRLPNSTWIEWYKFITENMLSVKSLDKIQFELDKKGIKQKDEIILYCFKGARLSNSYIALRKLGYENIKIYFAGWNEWCRKTDAPFINEVENTNNPLLQENIALKKQLDKLQLEKTKLIDFPKYNKEPIFAFEREGELSICNNPKKEKLPFIKEYMDIFPEDTKNDIYNMIDNNLEKNTVIKKDNSYYSFRLLGSREANRILVYGHDITQIKKNEKQLIEQSKLAALGEMIGNIAHQWRQPLSVISTAATGMQLQKEYNMLTDDIFLKSCNSINDNVQYLSKTIDDFKNFIQGDRTKKYFCFQETIDSFLQLVDGKLKSNNIQLLVNIEENIIINGYENELLQCLMNIVNNSIDALIEEVTGNRFIFITSFIKDHIIYIKISDNAKGISEDVLPNIFEPYFTTKHQSLGTGLGLHMTYNLIVEGMKGTIEASNVSYEYNEYNYIGAEFLISLPT